MGCGDERSKTGDDDEGATEDASSTKTSSSKTSSSKTSSTKTGDHDDDEIPLGACLNMAPIGPCLEMVPDPPSPKEPRLGPCLKISYQDDETIDQTPPKVDPGVPLGPCLDIAPADPPPVMDVCLSIAPPPDGPLKDDSQACLSEIPDDSQGMRLAPRPRDEALARVLDSGVLPPDVAERVEDLS